MKLFSVAEKRVVAWLLSGHLATLYVWGLSRHPIVTVALASVWLMLTLHHWPEEKA